MFSLVLGGQLQLWNLSNYIPSNSIRSSCDIKVSDGSFLEKRPECLFLLPVEMIMGQYHRC